MTGMKSSTTIYVDPVKIAKRAHANDKRAAMASGNVRKVATFAVKRGKGSYRRKGKYGGWS